MPTPISTHMQHKIDTAVGHVPELVRAHRLFLGLSQRQMAEHLGVERRSYQRIEKGIDPCPPGMRADIADLSDRFAREVELVLDEAERRERGDGPLELGVVVDGTPEQEWERTVAGRAAVETADDHPILLVVVPAQATIPPTSG